MSEVKRKVSENTKWGRRIIHQESHHARCRKCLVYTPSENNLSQRRAMHIVRNQVCGYRGVMWLATNTTCMQTNTSTQAGRGWKLPLKSIIWTTSHFNLLLQAVISCFLLLSWIIVSIYVALGNSQENEEGVFKFPLRLNSICHAISSNATKVNKFTAQRGKKCFKRQPACTAGHCGPSNMTSPYGGYWRQALINMAHALNLTIPLVHHKHLACTLCLLLHRMM